jgi:hypothetical protein
MRDSGYLTGSTSIDKHSRSSGDQLGTADLLAIAQTHDPKITSRTLEFWRHQDLLPHAKRVGQDGARPIWTYPAEAADQLCALLRLRAATRDPDLLRAALWLGGYPVPVIRAQHSMITVFRKLQADIEKELTKRSVTDEEHGRGQVLAEVARDMAASRKGPIPRFARQSLADRTTAFETILKLGLGETLPLQELATNADQVERVMGLHRGRHYRPNGVGPWLMGPADEGLALVQELGSLPKLTETLETATSDELEQARPFVRTLLTGIAAFSQMADAFAGYHNAAGLAAAVALKESPLIPVMILAWVISALRSETLTSNMTEVNEALTSSVFPVADRARQLAALPPDEQEARLARLPWSNQNQLRRLIKAFGTERAMSHNAQADET